MFQAQQCLFPADTVNISVKWQRCFRRRFKLQCIWHVTKCDRYWLQAVHYCHITTASAMLLSTESLTLTPAATITHTHTHTHSTEYCKLLSIIITNLPLRKMFKWWHGCEAREHPGQVSMSWHLSTTHRWDIRHSSQVSMS